MQRFRPTPPAWPPRPVVALAVVAFALALALAACGSSSGTPAPDGGPDTTGTLPPVDAAPDDGGPDAVTDAGPSLPAFPGAQGWAAATPGGRGGQIIRVTTLAAGGPGSLNAALTTAGPRIIVFEVGGVIDLQGARFLSIIQPYVTIAGQTAPSPGITLIRGGLLINTHDVIVQHIRVRPGEAGRAKMSGWEVDSISTSAAYNVIIDHCSATWGTDENLSASGERFQGVTPDDWRNGTSHVVTFSNNIVAEGLANSTHSEGEHSKGGLIHDNVTRIAIVNNLYFSNNDRHPLFKGGARGVVVNNYVGNPGRDAMRYNLSASEWTGHAPELGQMAIVGNVYQAGPNTMPDVPLLRVTGIGQVEVFLSDNVAKTAAGADAPSIGGTAAANAVQVTAPPLWPDGLTAMPAASVKDSIRANVGARPWDRDAIDARIVELALSGGGAIINSEQDVGGYPAHAPTQAPFVEDDWDLRYMVPKAGYPDAGVTPDAAANPDVPATPDAPVTTDADPTADAGVTTDAGAGADAAAGD
jgi:pectate lyase